MKRLIVVVSLALAPLAVAGTAHANPTYTPGCKTATYAWKIFVDQGGGHVGDLHESGTICWGSAGKWQTGTKVSMTITNTTYGSFYGFNWKKTDGTYIWMTRSEGGYGGQDRTYASDWDATPCEGVKGFSFCGNTAAFKTTIDLVDPASFGKPYWGFGTPNCSNSWCRNHMTFQGNPGST